MVDGNDDKGREKRDRSCLMARRPRFPLSTHVELCLGAVAMEHGEERAAAGDHLHPPGQGASSEVEMYTMHVCYCCI